MSDDGIRCPSCGAPAKATGVCKFCNVSVLVDGVAGRTRNSDLKCPRCKEKPALRGVDLEGLHVDVCMACHGVMFGLGGLDRALEMSKDRPIRPGEGISGPHEGGIEPVRYSRCPHCDSGMNRVPWCKKPLIIIDRCGSHGDWCDGGELTQLKALARTRGLDSLGDRAQRNQVRRSAADPDNPLDGKKFVGESILTREMLNEESRKGWGGGRRRRRGTDLFDILWGMFEVIP
jgi:Zn-finger nucleic acid-binding protein